MVKPLSRRKRGSTASNVGRLPGRFAGKEAFNRKAFSEGVQHASLCSIRGVPTPDTRRPPVAKGRVCRCAPRTSRVLVRCGAAPMRRARCRVAVPGAPRNVTVDAGRGSSELARGHSSGAALPTTRPPFRVSVTASA